MNSSITKLAAAAAVILISAVLWHSYFGGSLEVSSVALGDVLEKMSEVPFMQIDTTEVHGEVKRKNTMWFNFQNNTNFAKYDDAIWCWDIKEKKEYMYRFLDKLLIVQELDEKDFHLSDSAYSLVESFIGISKSEGMKITREKELVNGIHTEIFKVRKVYGEDTPMTMDGQPVYAFEISLAVNPETSLLVEGNIKYIDKNDQMITLSKLEVTYPEDGPSGIYDLGVPRTTKIFYKDRNKQYVISTPDYYIFEGPQPHVLSDGSEVYIHENAKIKIYHKKDETRGFELLCGQVDVNVKKAESNFVITTPYANVKALGTSFSVDLMDFKEGSSSGLKLMEVNVDSGVVEVSNPEGEIIAKEGQRVIVEEDKAPYDFTQDEKLPKRLIERIQSMLKAMETGDKKAWVSNFNINAMYDLAKGKIEFDQHRDWFSGMSEEDAEHFKQVLSDVNSPEQLAEMFLASMSDEICKLYVRSVALDEDGKHAMAVCVKKRGQMIGFTPQWTFFDGDWWQTDD